ncbi:MAG TPA: hypothetical protein VGE00_06905 [Gammaproteobacteria bacterium]
MERKRLALYSALSSTGMLMLVLSAFLEGLEASGLLALGMFLFFIAGLVENPNLGNERFHFSWVGLARLFVAIAILGGVMWLMRTEFGQTHKVAIWQVFGVFVACSWSALLGYKWGQLAGGNQRESA